LDDPYVLSSQVSQIYYVHDDKNPDWCCVVRTKPRNVYDVGKGEGTMMKISTTIRVSH
jgi:hypothetical protein